MATKKDDGYETLAGQTATAVHRASRVTKVVHLAWRDRRFTYGWAEGWGEVAFMSNGRGLKGTAADVSAWILMQPDETLDQAIARVEPRKPKERSRTGRKLESKRQRPKQLDLFLRMGIGAGGES